MTLATRASSALSAALLILVAAFPIPAGAKSWFQPKPGRSPASGKAAARSHEGRSATVMLPIAAPTWDAAAQGNFVMAMVPDTQGKTWFGTEDMGLWRYDPRASPGKAWTHFTAAEGLGDASVYALAADRLGRVWAGTLNHGVSVYNGAGWRTYGPENALPGSRVFCIATCPTDGDIWIGTEAGLVRYSLSKDRWSCFTRFEGLPSDQVNALAFDRSGNVYAGTQCDGLAIGSATSGYERWRTVPGPEDLPRTPRGPDLPSSLVNAVLVTRRGDVVVGTTRGVSVSTDGGRRWIFTRGADWDKKLADLGDDNAPINASIPGDLLTEDYVTSLSETPDGMVAVGHRQSGVETIDPETGKRVSKDDLGGGYAESLLTARDGLLVGQYGGGVRLVRHGAPASPVAAPSVGDAKPIAFPSPAPAPAEASLRVMARQIANIKSGMSPGDVAFMGEDWTTQGDWVGTYGSRYAVLCAAAAPIDHEVISDFSYIVRGTIGPLHRPDEGLRHWLQWMSTDDPRVMWDPVVGTRRESEWDDHSEAYDMTYPGVDVWAIVSVPAGMHRMTTYCMNKDGHDGPNRWRDYVLEVRASPGGGAGSAGPVLARCRIHNFWGGVYDSFAVCGPTVVCIRVGKNNSFNTVLQSVLLDKLDGPATPWESRRSVWLGSRLPLSAGALPDVGGAELPKGAAHLWSALDGAYWKPRAFGLQKLYRLLAYRAAAGSAPQTAVALAEWRARLSIWRPEDRAAFLARVQGSWESIASENPDLKTARR